MLPPPVSPFLYTNKRPANSQFHLRRTRLPPYQLTKRLQRVQPPGKQNTQNTGWLRKLPIASAFSFTTAPHLPTRSSSSVGVVAASSSLCSREAGVPASSRFQCPLTHYCHHPDSAPSHPTYLARLDARGRGRRMCTCLASYGLRNWCCRRTPRYSRVSKNAATVTVVGPPGLNWSVPCALSLASRSDVA